MRYNACVMFFLLLAGCTTSTATVQFDDYQCQILRQRHVNTSQLCKRPTNNNSEKSAETTNAGDTNRRPRAEAVGSSAAAQQGPSGGHSGGGQSGPSGGGGGRPPSGGGTGGEINTDPPDRMGDHSNEPNRPSDCCEPTNP